MLVEPQCYFEEEQQDEIPNLDDSVWERVLGKLTSMCEAFSKEMELDYEGASFKPEELIDLGLPRLLLQAGILRFLSSSYWEAWLDRLLERSFEIEVGLDAWLRRLRRADAEQQLLDRIRANK